MKRAILVFSLGFAIMAGSVQTVSAYWNEYYIPFVGISYINNHPDHNYNIRFTNQDMYWKAHNLGAYQYADDTYEHETIFYDYDDHAFARSYVNANWWSSTLPDPYLDTQALDNPDEPNIAVGTFNPNLIVPDTYYNYYVALNKTSSVASFYKIQGQKSYSWCEAGPWCVLTQQDTTKVIPFASPFTVPEYRMFRYEWESNNTTAVADRISLGQWASGVIAHGADNDFFIFNVPSSRTVKMLLKLNGVSSPNNYDVEIYRKNTGQWVAGSYNGVGVDESITSFLTSGDYLAKIYPQAGSNDDKTYHFLAY
jgi:hypothetical protein